MKYIPAVMLAALACAIAAPAFAEPAAQELPRIAKPEEVMDAAISGDNSSEEAVTKPKKKKKYIKRRKNRSGEYRAKIEEETGKSRSHKYRKHSAAKSGSGETAPESAPQ